MNRRARRVFIVLPVLVTLIVAGVVGVLAVLQNQRQTDQVATAESVGQDYLSNVASFRLSATRKIHAVDSGSAAKLERAVTAATAKPPNLPEVSAYGRTHSKTYRQAEQTASTLLLPYRQLSATLARAEVSETFIKAARKVLALRATDYVGSGLISSSEKVRSALIPVFSKARDGFVAVKVPAGQERLAEKVYDAAQYVIDQSSTLAARIDARQNFSFTYNEQFQAAADAIGDYATEVQGDVEEAIQTATNDS